MDIAINITNVDSKKLVDGSRFVTEFMPLLEELGATYNIVYKKDKYIGSDSNNDNISMVFSNKPNDIKEFIDILDSLSKYFSDDLLDNGDIISLN